MKRPSLFTYLIGNPFSGLGIVGFGGYLIYAWFQGRTTGFVALLAAGAISMAVKAGDQLTEYYFWKRQWDAMAGIAPGERFAWLWRKVNKPIAVALWLSGAYGITTLDPRKPETGLATLGFAAGTLMIIGVLLYRWRKRVRRRRPAKVVPVDIALEVPRRSPGPKEFMKGVPGYCARLNQG